MTKHTAIIFLAVFVIIVALGGFPSWVRTTLLVLSGIGIAVLAYLSSVIYCSNCKKLIEYGENILVDSTRDAKEEAPRQKIQ